MNRWLGTGSNGYLDGQLCRAYPNGSYPNFSEVNNKGQLGRSGDGVVWKDAAASMSWNAQWFEHFTRFVGDTAQIKITSCTETVHAATKRFVYTGSPRTVKIFSWWPPRNLGLYIHNKRIPTPPLAIFPPGIYEEFREAHQLKGARR